MVDVKSGTHGSANAQRFGAVLFQAASAAELAVRGEAAAADDAKCALELVTGRAKASAKVRVRPTPADAGRTAVKQPGPRQST